MEVWVRSQDKEKLLQIKGTFYKKDAYEAITEWGDMTKKTPIPHKKEVVTRDCVFSSCGIFLGEYPTKERCLEIIDEIQSLFCDFLICKDVSPCDHPQFQKLGLTSVHYKGIDFEPTIEYHERSSIVYEMPKE